MLSNFAVARTGSISPLQSAQSGSFWKVFTLTLVSIFAISAGNLLDPVLRYDDFPALLAQPEGFWAKTLSEGRWLNYFWHMRGIVTPAWLNFAIYQAIWALFAAAFAMVVIPGHGRIWFACVLALTILVAPPALLMAPWFNTLFPGTALLATYAVLATRLSQFALRALLPVFTLLTFMAYTTFPVVLLLICLVRTEHRSLKDLAGLVLLFGVSFCMAVLAVYVLNWQMHGVFGVVLDASRQPTPAVDVPGLIKNFELLTASMEFFLHKMSFNSQTLTACHLGMLTVATLVLIRRAPLEALYLHFGLWIGMALIAVQVLKLGVTIPTRALHFAWIAYAVLIVRAAEELTRNLGFSGRLACGAVLLIIISYLLVISNQFTLFRKWQTETRALAQDLTVVSGPIYVVGDVRNHPSAVRAGIQQPSALAGRLRQLTGHNVIICETSPDACSSLLAEWLPPVATATATAQMQVQQLNGASVIVVPPRQ